MYTILITPHFRKLLKKFTDDNPDSKPKIIKSLSELITDPDHPSLRTHKLGMDNEWSLSFDTSDRITFTLSKDSITLLDIGKHDDIYE